MSNWFGTHTVCGIRLAYKLVTIFDSDMVEEVLKLFVGLRLSLNFRPGHENPHCKEK